MKKKTYKMPYVIIGEKNIVENLHYSTQQSIFSLTKRIKTLVILLKLYNMSAL